MKKLILIIAYSFTLFALSTFISAMENNQNKFEEIIVYEESGRLIAPTPDFVKEYGSHDFFSRHTPTTERFTSSENIKFDDEFFEKYPSDVYKATIIHVLNNIEQHIKLKEKGIYANIMNNNKIPLDARKIIPLAKSQKITLKPVTKINKPIAQQKSIATQPEKSSCCIS